MRWKLCLTAPMKQGRKATVQPTSCPQKSMVPLKYIFASQKDHTWTMSKVKALCLLNVPPKDRL